MDVPKLVDNMMCLSISSITSSTRWVFSILTFFMGVCLTHFSFIFSILFPLRDKNVKTSLIQFFICSAHSLELVQLDNFKVSLVISHLLNNFKFGICSVNFQVKRKGKMSFWKKNSKPYP
jgi:hypothetical protein